MCDDIYYFYDDSGQLSRAAKATQGLAYDANGNLISIVNGSASTNAPTISRIAPDVLFIGATTTVVISGQSLFSTKTVTSQNPYMKIHNLSVTDTQISA
jgi:YD repeat-containing protein